MLSTPFRRISALFLFTVVFSIHVKAQQDYSEKYSLDWLKTKEWKVAQQSDMVPFFVTMYVHPNESMENWTELGNTTHYKDVQNMPIDSFMYKILDQAKMTFPNAKLTFLEKKEKTPAPWILFTVEIVESHTMVQGNAQIYHITVGKKGIYSSYVTVQRGVFTKQEVKKWSKFLKTCKLKIN